MVYGRDDWRTAEDGNDLALAWREYGMWHGRRESLPSEWTCRLGLRPHQGRREDTTAVRRRDCRRVRRRADRDRGQATIAIPVDRPDELRSLPRIPDGLSHCPHRTAQGRFTDELVGPDLFTELVLGHNTITVFQEVHQDFKGFGPELDGLSRTREDMELGIELTRTKV
jgi:hypothetical protein